MRLRGSGWVIVAVLYLAWFVPTVFAAGNCGLGCNACTSPCAGGCLLPDPVRHVSEAACTTGGSFNFRGTEFQDTCLLGAGCTIAEPPLRFWQFDDFALANAGCDPRQPGKGLANAGLDAGTAPENGHWLLHGLDWADAPIDGCVDASGGAPRTVAEISFPDSPREGSVSHKAWYLVASVAKGAGGFDFDQVQGATGCNPADVVVAEVPKPRGARSCETSSITCGGAWGMPNMFGGMGFDVLVDLPGTPPAGYGDAGTPPLISGYQIVYASGDEPTSSDACLGGWQPVRLPADPSQAMGVVPLGAGKVWVTIPATLFGSDSWIALRLVYADASVNPTDPFDPATSSGPLLMSAVSGHCGPLRFVFEDPMANVAKKNDVNPPYAAVRPGDPVTYTLTVQVMAIGPPEVRVVDVFDQSCLDLSEFDPVAKPWQVLIDGSPPLPTWDAASATLALTAVVDPGLDRTVLIRGIKALADTASCCNVASADASGCPRLSPPSCFAIDSSVSCAVPPAAVTGLKAIKLSAPPPFQGLGLSWDQASDAATLGYGVYEVTNGDRTLIPIAGRAEASVNPDIVAVCAAVPAGTPGCFVPKWLGPESGPLLYYQVRGGCVDGSEGP